MDLTAFIAARLDEDEAMAMAAQRTAMPAGELARQAGPCVTEAGYAHIARHDPARVLREVAAMRALVAMAGDDLAAEYEPGDGEYSEGSIRASKAWANTTLRHLAAIWSDHGDYPGAVAPPPAIT